MTQGPNEFHTFFACYFRGLAEVDDQGQDLGEVERQRSANQEQQARLSNPTDLILTAATTATATATAPPTTDHQW